MKKKSYFIWHWKIMETNITKMTGPNLTLVDSELFKNGSGGTFFHLSSLYGVPGSVNSHLTIGWLAPGKILGFSVIESPKSIPLLASNASSSPPPIRICIISALFGNSTSFDIVAEKAPSDQTKVLDASSDTSTLIIICTNIFIKGLKKVFKYLLTFARQSWGLWSKSLLLVPDKFSWRCKWHSTWSALPNQRLGQFALQELSM